MSFLKTIPQELLSAAAQLEGIGTSLTAQNAGAAAPTTAIAPAAADQVSILQSGSLRPTAPFINSSPPRPRPFSSSSPAPWG